MAFRRPLLSLSIPVLLLLATACGSSSAGSVHIAWQSQDGGPVRLQLASDDTYRTSVLVHNDTGEVVRDARLRLRPNQHAVLGLEVGGTVTNARTLQEYDGDYWRLGDLRPGDRITFPIALWFDVSPGLRTSAGMEMTIDLVSPDLGTPLTSAPLRVVAQ